jgi:hypothetical protein
MANYKPSSELMARLALSVIGKEQTIQETVVEHDLPEWVVTESVVKLVQSAHKLMYGTSDSDSHTERVCFVHVEKTAGTSVSFYLDDGYDTRDICPALLHDDLVQLATVRDIKNYKLLHGHFYSGWLDSVGINTSNTKFVTFVRHPLQRQLSSYKHWMGDQVKRGYLNPFLGGYNVQTIRLSPLGMRRGYATMHDHLQAAKSALESYFFIGVQEQFSESLNALSVLLGRPVIDSLPEHNVSRLHVSELPQAVIDEVISENWADIELYEFAVAMFEKRFTNKDAFAVSPAGQWTPQQSINYRVNQALHGTGWWAREGLEGPLPQSWRWSGPGCESQILFHLDATKNYKLSVRVVNSIVPELLNTLRISINGALLEMTRQSDGQWGVLYEGLVPQHLFRQDAPNTTLQLAVAETKKFSTVDPSSKDDRVCGIAVSEVNFQVL